jgi:protein-disulfide isomerase
VKYALILLAVVTPALVTPALAATPVKPAAKPVAKPAAATTNWATTLAMTPEGGILRGNPKARVKIIEYASLTCPHCKAFARDSETAMARYIGSGDVSLEFRSFLLNPFDLAASLLALCGDARRNAGLVDKFFKEQESWTKPFASIPDAEGQRIGGLPPAAQPAALADFGGLAAFTGLSQAEAKRCLADQKRLDALLASRQTAVDKYALTGTPTFVINGVSQTNIADWATLEPKLRLALKP